MYTRDSTKKMSNVMRKFVAKVSNSETSHKYFKNLSWVCEYDGLFCGLLFGIKRLNREMSNNDLRDRFVYPFLKLMLDSFSFKRLGACT